MVNDKIGGKMARWTVKLENSITLAGKQADRKDFLNAFFESEVYIPKNEAEEREFNEFSLVMSSMAILIFVALADGTINPLEKQRIIDDLIFQLNQRPLEHKKLAEFGNFEKDIIGNIYDKIVEDYQTKRCDLDHVVKVIDMVYSNNPEKRQYLVRLSYYCGYSDGVLKESEEQAIIKVSEMLKVGNRQRLRIAKEVREEMNL